MADQEQRKIVNYWKRISIFFVFIGFILFCTETASAGWAPLRMLPYQNSVSLYYDSTGFNNTYDLNMGTRLDGASSVRFEYSKSGIAELVWYGGPLIRLEVKKSGSVAMTIIVTKNNSKTRYKFQMKVLNGKTPNVFRSFKLGTKEFKSRFNNSSSGFNAEYHCHPGTWKLSITPKTGWKVRSLWRQTWEGVKWLQNNKNVNINADQGVIGVVMEQPKNKLFVLYMFCHEGDLPAPQLSISQSTATMVKGTTLQLRAIKKNTTEAVKWSSGNKKVVSVSSTGKVTAKKNGTATITASCDGLKVKCKITVKALGKPQLGTIKSWSSGSACTITWGKVSCASGYQVQYQYKYRGSSKWVSKTKKVSSTKCSLTGFSNPCQLKVKVRAYVIINKKYSYGAWCGIKNSNSSDYDAYGKAMKAYSSYLAGHKNVQEFAIALIDADGIPELIILDDNWDRYIYSYNAGGMRTRCAPRHYEFSYYGIAFDKYYPKTGIIRGWSVSDTHRENYYCQLGNPGLFVKLIEMYDMGDRESGRPEGAHGWYDASYNSLSRGGAQTRLKNLTNGKSAVTIRYSKNTKANRKKILS